MKQLLLLFIVYFSASTSWCQELHSSLLKNNDHSAIGEVLTKQIDMNIDRNDTSVITPFQYFLVNPKPGLHYLPQDNMPCIVPDPSATVVIPNTWQGEINVPFKGYTPRMPNPSKRLRIKPSRPLLMTPEISN